MEFHISRQSRERYAFDQAIYTYSGNVIFANFHAARLFAQKINQQRDLSSFPEQAVRASQINALGMLDEVLHHVIALYRRNQNPRAFEKALAWLEESLGSAELDRALEHFSSEFPPLAVYRGEISLADYMQAATDGTPNREIILEELLMLWVENRNPACSDFLELFDDSRLSAETAYPRLITSLHRFFETQPTFGPDRLNLIDLLRSPAINSPHLLTGQLEFINDRWSEVLGKYLYRLLSSLDLVKEEEKAAFFGPGPTVIPALDDAAMRAFAMDARAADGSSLSEIEYEAFTQDREWMPRLVLIAKNTYVWLDQLSKKYQRAINRLDMIPSEELAELATRGFTGLWLIGLWERSRASAQIKQLCGNPDAIASAYSLFNYDIAADLGGEEAYRGLRDHAWQHGIRLASDMVPNHMGIDSPWVVEHPDWFVQLDYSPYPSYSFSGPDLSANPAFGIYLEDHYFNRTDASVVFRLEERWNGRNRYVYHGNDGTTMPWNDTAQLNYLNAEVREAVIQTILAVARRFPIIRFDAAMTLAKRHYQRLWYPEPGTGGAIPSRAEQGLTKEEFNRAFPVEFWREVVDRMAVESPDTLLLAEAFWMMEGYFVRTLGMHRVYNSAFMNMLHNEENAKYRTLIKNTIEFEPEILKRYVNFMNNPDERTAVDQFGKGDKYFGICVLMATLPGLPMFGHGQVEGFAEKYGMEFRKALWEEQVDGYLVERHAREVFPLLHQRALFAGVDNFLLYDFTTATGVVDENVIAYSNQYEGSRALVVYNNRYGGTEGCINISVPGLIRSGSSDKMLSQRSLAESLGLHPDKDLYTIARDQASGLEFIFSSFEIATRGLQLTLNGCQYHVFLDFREVRDDEWRSYYHLCTYLNGRGVPIVIEALRELALQPVLGPFREIANPGYISYLVGQRIETTSAAIPPALLEEAAAKLEHLLNGIEHLSGFSNQRDVIQARLQSGVAAALTLPIMAERYPLPSSKTYNTFFAEMSAALQNGSLPRWTPLVAWIFIRDLGRLSNTKAPEGVTRSWIDEWQLGKCIEDAARGLGLDPAAAGRAVTILRLLTDLQGWYKKMGRQTVRQYFTTLLDDEEIRRFLQVNRYKDILWFNQEAFDEFVFWLNLLAVFDALSDENASASLLAENVLICGGITARLKKACLASDYQVVKLLAGL